MFPPPYLLRVHKIGVMDVFFKFVVKLTNEIIWAWSSLYEQVFDNKLNF